MTQASLTIDTNAICANWQALDAKSAGNVETAAVVKADGYGLDAGHVAAALAKRGVRTFFVAVAEEGIAVRKAVGNAPDIFVFSGMMLTDASVLKDHNLIPLLNAPEQFIRFRNELPDADFGVQLDSGMNRLGMEADEFAPLRHEAATAALTEGLDVHRSLAATGGTLLGADYHFDLCRPGIGLYGGSPFEDANAVVQLDIPVIQTRRVLRGETVGYGANWRAQRNSQIATIAAGYADGLIRAMGNGAVQLFAGDSPCPVIGRVSMDLITVDVTDLDSVPDTLQLLNKQQTVDSLADAAGTIGYEILTSLGARYARQYIGI